MPAFMKLGDIKGEATAAGHQEWILVDSLSAPVHRSIPRGAKDQQRTKGETVLGDVVVVRQMDKSSPKLMEACANGTFFDEVQIHLATTVKNRQEPYLKYKLHNVIVTSYSFHGLASDELPPTEEVTFNYTKANWIYVIVDPQTGDVKGNVPARYSPGEGTS